MLKIPKEMPSNIIIKPDKGGPLTQQRGGVSGNSDLAAANASSQAAHNKSE